MQKKIKKNKNILSRDFLNFMVDNIFLTPILLLAILPTACSGGFVTILLITLTMS